MIDSQKLNGFDINELLTYFNATNAICTRLENKLRPLYNSTIREEQEKFLALNKEFQEIDFYRNAIMSVMKSKIINNLS
jgi:hypothetical protein